MSGFDSHAFHPSDEFLNSAAAGTNTVASLQAGHPFSLVLAEDDGLRDAMLENTLDAVADTATRFARATNPLRARLTLERLLIQVIQGGVDPGLDTPAAIIRKIAQRRGDETRVVLVIERAETLHPEVLRFFGETASLFPDGVPRLQLLFVGRPAFRRMMDDPDAGFDEQIQQLDAYKPAEAEPAFVPMLEASASDLPARAYKADEGGMFDQLRSMWNQGLVTRIGIVAGTLGGVAALAFAAYIAFSGPEPQTAADPGSALLEMPEPPDSEPEPPVLQPGPPRDEATAVLRSEFEAYLTASGRDLQNATPGQKRAIYQEFLVWRTRTAQPKMR